MPLRAGRKPFHNCNELQSMGDALRRGLFKFLHKLYWLLFTEFPLPNSTDNFLISVSAWLFHKAVPASGCRSQRSWLEWSEISSSAHPAECPRWSGWWPCTGHRPASASCRWRTCWCCPLRPKEFQEWSEVGFWRLQLLTQLLIAIKQIGEVRLEPVHFKIHVQVGHVVESEPTLGVEPSLRVHGDRHVLRVQEHLSLSVERDEQDPTEKTVVRLELHLGQCKGGLPAVVLLKYPEKDGCLTEYDSVRLSKLALTDSPGRSCARTQWSWRWPAPPWDWSRCYCPA